MYSLMKTNMLVKIASDSLVRLPCPANINYHWNYGSLLGLMLAVQLLTGLFLSMHYNSDMTMAFDSVNHIMQDINYGWILRATHANGASMFFVMIYAHTFRGIYYGAYKNTESWMSGVSLLLLLMAISFLGYVLPWGQMSFWGATVITNFFSAVPYIGGDLVQWMWGGFAVSRPTLSRFFSLHFCLPFLMLMIVLIHLMMLHTHGSSNPLGLNSNKDKIVFHPYYSSKDLLGFLLALTGLMCLVFYFTWSLGDVENFIKANPLVTPLHIQPEWYFLFAYAILRAVPNKLGGVLALVLSIAILYTLPLASFKPPTFSVKGALLFWSFLNIVVLLTWIGACPVEYPFTSVGQGLSISYFMFFMILLIF
uniref:cytochrome b n=1 Tax=Lamproglena chinensis TaxID=342427 RepID=UPI00286CCB9F|nr:cytochrome b [Lamproglena chinensis]WKF18929.1 cytochrome b [Lamproglena chinensis]